MDVDLQTQWDNDPDGRQYRELLIGPPTWRIGMRVYQDSTVKFVRVMDRDREIPLDEAMTTIEGYFEGRPVQQDGTVMDADGTIVEPSGPWGERSRGH